MTAPKLKRCNVCKIPMPLDAFARLASAPDGRQYRCRSCQAKIDADPRRRQRRVKYRHSEAGQAAQERWERSPKGRRYRREKHLRQSYQVDAETFARLAEAQDRRCAGCGKDLDLGPETHVDHDHETGKIRGLLCRGCNIALGGVKDSVLALHGLIAYLRHARNE